MKDTPLALIKDTVLPRKLGRISFCVRLVLYLLVAYWLFLDNSQREIPLLIPLIFFGYFLPFVALPRARDCGMPTWMILILMIPVFSTIPLFMLLFTRGRLSVELPKDEVPIPFRKHLWWIFVFVGIPWMLFGLILIFNGDYESKFFKPVNGDPYLGLSMLVIAITMTAMTYPLSIQFQRLRFTKERTKAQIFQMVVIALVGLAFTLQACAIILLTPAAFTMVEQMNASHRDY